MKTQQAYEQYQMYAQAQREYYETLTWVLFDVVILAPILMAIIYISVVLYLNKKGKL